MHFAEPALAALLVASIILAGRVIAAGPANNPGARRDYRIRNVDPKAADDLKDGRMWRIREFSIWSEEGSYEGQPATVLKREEHSAQGDRVLWEVTVAPDLRPFQTKHKIYTRQNKMIADSTTIYADHFYRFPQRTIDFMTISWALERIDFTIGRRSDYWMALGPEIEPWQLFMTPEAEETVTVPAGTFQCVRVKVENSTDNPPFGLKKLPKIIVRWIVSSSTGWVTKDTHIMVKFQSKLDGPGAPEKAQELVRIR